MSNVVDGSILKPFVPEPWPKWVKTPAGKDVQAQGHEHARTLSGKPYMPDGNIEGEAPIMITPDAISAEQALKDYVPAPWPKWVTDKNGRQLIAQHHEHARSLTGEDWQEDGTVGKPRPKPPTLEVVIAAGYARDVAEKIVENEQKKAAMGYKPYGDIEPPPPPPPPAQNDPATSTPAATVSTPAAEQGAESNSNVEDIL